MLFLKLFTFFEKMRKLLLEEVRGHTSLEVLSENITEANYITQVTDSRENIVSWQTEFTVLCLNKEI